MGDLRRKEALFERALSIADKQDEWIQSHDLPVFSDVKDNPYYSYNCLVK